MRQFHAYADFLCILYKAFLTGNNNKACRIATGVKNAFF